MNDEIDTGNYQMVSARGDDIIVLRAKNKMTKDEALLHAAWLVAMVGDHEKFEVILDAVQNT